MSPGAHPISLLFLAIVYPLLLKQEFKKKAATEKGKHGHYNVVVWPLHITTTDIVRIKLCLKDLPSKIQ